ncbi:cell wall-binding repeat-containing protein [Ornithinimicrobium cavernae]|uniref:cell wall-binding repeat-containing protein n=1 Tax=Ornithinimicrobium cavernae TaxID=2666047 RepID=UPI000D69AADD|nr:cell wall-binding repeat-containing protein [Ornithinimicrobium cavernae]
MSRTLSLALASAASLALLAPAALAAPNDSEAAAAAAAYIADQVPESGDLGGAGGTADAVLALLAAGGHEAEVEVMTDYLESQAEAYAGAGGPAAGKLALVAAATGRTATDFGGVDLIAAIQGSITDEGVCGGFAYAFGNALCILGLDRNDTEVPQSLLTRSYEFQDPETGAFGFTGENGFVAENDASGLMLSALSGLADDRDAALSAAAVRDYLVGAQTDGYWEGFAPVNTTGLVAPALETVGVDQAAAVEWLAGQQLDDGSLPNEIDGETGDLMATTQGMVPFTGESYLSVGEGGVDSVELVVNPESVLRVAGTDRYATAAAASRVGKQEADTVVVATGEQFADALTGSALAGAQDGPVLLVRPDHLPAATAAELNRLKPSTVLVLGGGAAVSDEVMTALEEYAGEVTRVSGSNRYETAANIAGRFTGEVDHLYVATGETYADALAASAVAGAQGEPVLLVQQDHIPAATAERLSELDVASITVLGGAGAVSDEVVTSLEAHADEVVRVAGQDRYATAAALSEKLGGPDGAVLATGLNYPDALTGAAYAAAYNRPVLLVQADRIPAATLAELDRFAAQFLSVLGGPGAVNQTVVEQLEGLNYAG